MISQEDEDWKVSQEDEDWKEHFCLETDVNLNHKVLS